MYFTLEKLLFKEEFSNILYKPSPQNCYIAGHESGFPGMTIFFQNHLAPKSTPSLSPGILHLFRR